MSSLLAAACCICTIDHEPSIIVAILPSPSSFFEFSQLVVVGSASVTPALTASYSRESMMKCSLPVAQGASSLASFTVACVSLATAPRLPSHWVSGQPSL